MYCVSITSKAFSCVAVAVFKNMENPGSFGDVLNKLLSSNGLPTLNIDCISAPLFNIFPPCPPPQADGTNYSVTDSFQSAGSSSAVASFTEDTLPAMKTCCQ